MSKTSQMDEFLSSRLNFFLLANSFLVAALATLLAIEEVKPLLHLIFVLGTFLSLWFLFMQYFASLTIDKGIEHSRRIYIRSAELTPINLRWFGEDIWALVCNPIDYFSRHNATHHWLIPFVFCLFWFFGWWFTVESVWWPILFYSLVISLMFHYSQWKGKFGLLAILYLGACITFQLLVPDLGINIDHTYKDIFEAGFLFAAISLYFALLKFLNG